MNYVKQNLSELYRLDMAGSAELEEEDPPVRIDYVQGEDLVKVTMCTNPEGLVMEVDDEYQNITNRQEVMDRLSAVGLSWADFLRHLETLPEFSSSSEETFYTISENKINEIMGSLMVQKQQSEDFELATQVDNDLNHDEEKRDEA